MRFSPDRENMSEATEPTGEHTPERHRPWLNGEFPLTGPAAHGNNRKSQRIVAWNAARPLLLLRRINALE